MSSSLREVPFAELQRQRINLQKTHSAADIHRILSSKHPVLTLQDCSISREKYEIINKIVNIYRENGFPQAIAENFAYLTMKQLNELVDDLNLSLEIAQENKVNIFFADLFFFADLLFLNIG